MDALEQIALEAYDRMIGLELADVSVDGCITKAPCGGQKAGRHCLEAAHAAAEAALIEARRRMRLNEERGR